MRMSYGVISTLMKLCVASVLLLYGAILGHTWWLNHHEMQTKTVGTDIAHLRTFFPDVGVIERTIWEEGYRKVTQERVLYYRYRIEGYIWLERDAADTLFHQYHWEQMQTDSPWQPVFKAELIPETPQSWLRFADMNSPIIAPRYTGRIFLEHRLGIMYFVLYHAH